MNINKEEWNDMQHVPKKNQKCKVLIIKDMTYIGTTDEGHNKWQEDKAGEHRFFAWTSKGKGEPND